LANGESFIISKINNDKGFAQKFKECIERLTNVNLIDPVRAVSVSASRKMTKTDNRCRLLFVCVRKAFHSDTP